MENSELQSTYALINGIKFEEKIDIDDLVLPPEQTGSPNIKQEPLEVEDGNFLSVNERNRSSDLRVNSVGFVPIQGDKEIFQSELEKDITKLFEEFDMMSYNDFSQMRVKRVKQLFEKYQTFSCSREQMSNSDEIHEKNVGVKITESNKLKRESQSVEYEFGEIESNSLQKKIVEITEEHKAIMSLNSKTMNSIVKVQEKALEDKDNELNKVKDELRAAKSTNLKISKKIQELETFNVSKENESENLEKEFCCVNL